MNGVGWVWQVQWLANRTAVIVANAQPDIILFMAGTNDFFWARSGWGHQVLRCDRCPCPSPFGRSSPAHK